MPGKNSLSGLKRKPSSSGGVLPESGASNDRAAKGPLTGRKQVGRPRKKPEEKRDYKITLSLTQAEGQKIKEKAGLAGEATLVYAELEKLGLFK